MLILPHFPMEDISHIGQGLDLQTPLILERLLRNIAMILSELSSILLHCIIVQQEFKQLVRVSQAGTLWLVLETLLGEFSVPKFEGDSAQAHHVSVPDM